MKLNHLSLSVPDVAVARTFFEAHFAFRCTDVKGADTVAVLEGEDGFLLVLSNLQKDVQPVYPTDFHIGFILSDVEQVHATYERLKAAGVDLPQEVRKIRGSLAFYCYAPGQILLEVSSPL